MTTVTQQNVSFPKLARVMRNQRRLMVVNAFVTFAVFFGTFGTFASLVS